MNYRLAQTILAVALAAVLLVLLGRVLLLGESFGALTREATAAAVTGLGLLHSALRGSRMQTAGRAVTYVGLASLVVSLVLTAYLLLTCC